MLAGVGDEDIRREVQGTEDIFFRLSFEIIFFIESKEMGRHATENTRNVSAVFFISKKENAIF